MLGTYMCMPPPDAQLMALYMFLEHLQLVRPPNQDEPQVHIHLMKCIFTAFKNALLKIHLKSILTCLYVKYFFVSTWCDHTMSINLVSSQIYGICDGLNSHWIPQCIVTSCFSPIRLVLPALPKYTFLKCVESLLEGYIFFGMVTLI